MTKSLCVIIPGRNISGASLAAQARYAASALQIPQDVLEGWPIRDEHGIVAGCKPAGMRAGSCQIARGWRGEKAD
jgi:hypothetical protein